MDSSEAESQQEEPTEPTEQPKKRGRPVGVADQKPRYRRTAEEISADKLRIAQMKLDALRESEERKLANKKPRSTRKVQEAPSKVQETPPKVTESTLKVAPKKTIPQREETPSPRPVRSGRQALYDSWFPSSPRGRR